MVEDSRTTSRKDSEVVTVASGDGDVVDVIELGTEETLSVEYFKVDYSPAGTTTAEVTLYDEYIGTTSASVADDREKQFVAGGDTEVNDSIVVEDFENGVVVQTGGSQDADINVTVGGYLTTS
jgi:hypothetical protein